MARVQMVAVRIALVSALLGVSAPTLAHAAGDEAFWPEIQKLELGRPHWDLTGTTVWDDMARMVPRWFKPAAPTPAPAVQDVADLGAAPMLQTIAYSRSAPTLTGKAGWYGADFDGRLTVSGERFDMYRLTAASADLPLNSYVSVSNRATGETVVVRINDRRPQAGGELITLSKAAATRLSLDGEGGGAVELQLLGAAPPAGPVQVASR
jgi:rare lipoprotein A